MKFNTEPVQRDEYGDYKHSQLPDFDGAECVSKEVISKWQEEMDFTLVINHMDCEITEDHPALVHYFEDGDAGFGEWCPEAPSENAILLSIHDTEDGPVAWWAVERTKEAA
ncbi:hypothetical protein [Shewanella xiamenensis]|uniref:hypothetical protein n=1 Tax=Shewanella xiamenensis TaxID=332186 RepID=UPI0021C10C64|nr:hypothetical protein [Shewanella xiamenensis]MCT8866268.1 hypothetical protein [Shewanella xiamenensis]